MRRGFAVAGAIVLAVALCMPAVAANPERPPKRHARESATPPMAPEATAAPTTAAATPRATHRGRSKTPAVPKPTRPPKDPLVEEASSVSPAVDRTEESSPGTGAQLQGSVTLTIVATADADGPGQGAAVPDPGAAFGVGAWDPETGESVWSGEIVTGREGSGTATVPIKPDGSAMLDLVALYEGEDGSQAEQVAFTGCVDESSGEEVGEVYTWEAYVFVHDGARVRCDAIRRPSPTVLVLAGMTTPDGDWDGEDWELQAGWTWDVGGEGVFPETTTATADQEEGVAWISLWPLGGARTITVTERRREEFRFTVAVCDLVEDDDEAPPWESRITDMPLTLEIEPGGWYACVLVHTPTDATWTPDPGATDDPGGEGGVPTNPGMTPPETAALPTPGAATAGWAWLLVVALLGSVVGGTLLCTGRTKRRSPTVRR
jgi:hypothetical protein